MIALILTMMIIQNPSASEADLTLLRSILRSSRIAASNELDTAGSLPISKRAALKKSVENANALWIGCIATTVDANARSSLPATTIADQAMTTCRADGTEVAAWMRLGARADGETLSSREVSALMLKLDASNRQHAIDRVSSDRAR